jgi:import receptor subunit TOM20
MHFCSRCCKGPDFAVEAALAFFRALRVYPSPVELIMIFQNTVPEFIFKVCGFLFSSPL